MNAKFMRLLIALVISVGICIPSFAQCTVDSAIGYYSSADTSSCYPPVQAFCNNINATSVTGPLAGSANYFTTYNDSYWDNYSLGYVCAHGNQWLFALNDGYVQLDYLSDGWGDNNLEWVILYSCLVVASPDEEPTYWYQPWIIENTDVFDGLHIVNGFHTSAYVSPAVDVTEEYCDLVNSCGYVLESWFDAIYAEGYYWTQYDQGCSVFFGDYEYDTIADYNSADPAANETADFHCWYM